MFKLRSICPTYIQSRGNARPDRFLDQGQVLEIEDRSASWGDGRFGLVRDLEGEWLVVDLYHFESVYIGQTGNETVIEPGGVK